MKKPQSELPWLKSKRAARFITLLTSMPPNTTKEKIHFRGSLKNSLQTLDDNNIIVVEDSNTVTNNSIDFPMQTVKFGHLEKS